MGIKRWKLYSDYGDSAMCETGNQPAGHWHPVSEDDYVLHADHAAEVARLEARVEELTLKGKEREQIAVDDAELIQTLRAQLEAAKLLQESTAAELTHEEEGRRSWQKLAVLASERAMAAERQLEAAKEATRDANFDRNLAQLTAQPDGVREWMRRGYLLAMEDGWKMSNSERGQMERLITKALAAPAPAPSECYACKYSQGPHTHKREGI